ncbi:MFS general substrate transporter [Macrolepiota fuliginosa MF-IS2]|uniref:MFS general substrate transporter n=1 Tax=Macrolepiota fuliginosa MF-IS2 TaxID=1400762 RepID=A0A9P5X7Y2_9AGAR|nr:MFS general substrate transporter [Macrolepiota fuliginosa MF-IS2]
MSPDKLDLDEKHQSLEHRENSAAGTIIKLDSTGLPLIPQPNASETDPLNYPIWLKLLILFQVSILAFLATLNVAIVNPAVVLLADEFHIPQVTATYQTTVAIGTSAIGPLLFIPIANVYGRRPIYLFTLLIGFASAIGSAEAKSYGTLILARIFNGSGAATAAVLGAGTISDMCYMHQRGKAMGLYTVMLTNGGHLAPIIGGYVARSHGWRWCFWTGAMLNGAMLVICVFLLPETIYTRPSSSYDEALADLVKNDELDDAEVKELLKHGEIYHSPPFSLWTYFTRLKLWDVSPERHLKPRHFVVKPLGMLKYPSVAIPALFYGVIYGFASIEPALIVTTLFTRIYHFDTVQNGLANGISLLVGASLGELCSGPVTDVMMQRARRRALGQGKTAAAEVRLHGIWTGAITVPVGLLIFCTNKYVPDFASWFHRSICS